ncbi:MAG: ferric reductase-like transmembrane domain-containing protein [Burkholderiaceae bacterium]
MPITDFLAYCSSWAAVLGMGLLALEGLLSGRFSWLTGRWSIDAIMRIHQRLGRVVLILFMAHPLFYFLGDIRMSGSGLGLGFLALFALIAVVVMALSRDELPMRYEAWRRSHGLLAIGALGLGLAHARSGGWLGKTIPAVHWALVILTAVGVLALAWIYFVRPWALLRRPFRVLGLREIADRTWELRLEQVSGPVFCYQAGQFAWIKTQSAFGLHDHPFSIASAPARPGSQQGPVALTFLIKAVGDFTKSLGRHCTPGRTVYLDGPYGTFGRGLVDAPRLLLVAGGIGLAPLLSVLQARRDWVTAYGGQLVTQLVIGNRHPGQFFQNGELTDLPGLGLQVDRLVSEPTADWTGPVGQTDAQGLGPLLPQDPAGWQALVCGPPLMMQTVQAVLVGHGFKPNQIHMETFKT